MADCIATFTITISNAHTLARLADAISAFRDLYEDNGWQTDEGEELMAALSEFCDDMRVCSCGDGVSL